MLGCSSFMCKASLILKKEVKYMHRQSAMSAPANSCLTCTVKQLRSNPSQVIENSSENWRNTTPFFSAINFFQIQEKNYYYGKTFCRSYRYNKNILTTGTVTRYPLVTSCQILVLQMVFKLILYYFLNHQLLDPNSSKFWKPVL